MLSSSGFHVINLQQTQALASSKHMHQAAEQKKTTVSKARAELIGIVLHTGCHSSRGTHLFYDIEDLMTFMPCAERLRQGNAKQADDILRHRTEGMQLQAVAAENTRLQAHITRLQKVSPPDIVQVGWQCLTWHGRCTKAHMKSLAPESTCHPD